MDQKRKLIVIGRAPIKGRAKTRLIEEVGEKWAHRFYLAMLEDFFHNLSNSQAYFHEIVLGIDPYNEDTAEIFESLLDRHEVYKVRIVEQAPTHFFGRIDSLINDYAKQDECIHLTGTDVPIIDYEKICTVSKDGFNYLGPDKDGGFYYGVFNKKAFHTFKGFESSTAGSVYNELITDIPGCKPLEISSDLDHMHDISILCDSGYAPEHLKFVFNSYQLEQKRLLASSESRA